MVGEGGIVVVDLEVHSMFPALDKCAIVFTVWIVVLGEIRKYSHRLADRLLIVLGQGSDTDGMHYPSSLSGLAKLIIERADTLMFGRDLCHIDLRCSGHTPPMERSFEQPRLWFCSD